MKAGLWMICQACRERNYLHAYDIYMRLAIGEKLYDIQGDPKYCMSGRLSVSWHHPCLPSCRQGMCGIGQAGQSCLGHYCLAHQEPSASRPTCDLSLVGWLLLPARPIASHSAATPHKCAYGLHARHSCLSTSAHLWQRNGSEVMAGNAACLAPLAVGNSRCCMRLQRRPLAVKTP